jgi:3-oxoacyl-[acyl-carrier protein] reductase
MEKKSVLITGGSRGIGAASVRRFARSSYKVAFIYKEQDERAELLGRECSAYPIKADVGSEKEVRAAYAEAKKALGVNSFDVLVANAGIAYNGLVQCMEEKTLTDLIETDLMGVLYSARAALGDMISEKKGAMVFVSSMWGLRGASCETVYSAAKAGVAGFARSLAMEVGPSGIRVNAVAPGVIDTDMISGIDEDIINVLAEKTPLGRIGKPEEVADLIFYLAQDEASFVTGQVIAVDGGFSV